MILLCLLGALLGVFMGIGIGTHMLKKAMED